MGHSVTAQWTRIDSDCGSGAGALGEGGGEGRNRQRALPEEQGTGGGGEVTGRLGKCNGECRAGLGVGGWLEARDLRIATRRLECDSRVS